MGRRCKECDRFASFGDIIFDEQDSTEQYESEYGAYEGEFRIVVNCERCDGELMDKIYYIEKKVKCEKCGLWQMVELDNEGDFTDSIEITESMERKIRIIKISVSRTFYCKKCSHTWSEEFTCKHDSPSFTSI